MSSNIYKSIIKTIIYADIFGYPLTLDQIHKYLITNRSITKAQIWKEVQKIKGLDNFKKYFFLTGRKNSVQKRLQKEKESDKKLLIAKKAAFYLSFIPSILLIGISGNLAMKNATKNDDIDIFIICRKGTIWTSRLLSILLLKLLRLHRNYNSINIENKICLNMFVDQSALEFFLNNKNLYTAHEIIQMVPLFEKNNIYKQFLYANRWTINYLANALKYRTKQQTIQSHTESVFSIFFSIVLIILSFEFIAKRVQLFFINKHKTIEIITDKVLAFHPIDYRRRVLNSFEKRLTDFEK